MALSRFFVPFVKNTTKNIKFCITVTHSKGVMEFTVRHRSSFDITKNVCLITANNKKPKINNLKLEEPIEKPLVILLSWLMAKRKHIYKFADFYLEKGFDVLNVTITPWQLLWPVKGSQVIASDVLKFLDRNTGFNPLVVHAFSVGAYIWGEVLVQIAAEQNHYQHIIDRTAGQIYDSAADITEICVGLPFAVFPKNPVLQSALRQYIFYHMKTFDRVATCHYVRASQMFHTNIIRAPALFFLSKNDPIGAESSNLRARESWENMNIPVFWKCWDKSPHVLHYLTHKNEYVGEINKFFQYINISDNVRQRQIQAKL